MNTVKIPGRYDRGSLVFFHAPNSRAAATRALLDELEASYELVALNLRAGSTRSPEYLAVNPMGKVPAIVHEGALVSEQPAVFMYLAELFPEAGLAPALGDALRGPYLRWMVSYGSLFEPAIMDRAMKRDAPPPGLSPYGDYDTVIRVVGAQLGEGPYMLGDRFLALDVMWAAALRWLTGFKLVEATPAIAGYIERVTGRPSFVKAAAADAALVAGWEKATTA